MIAQRRVSAPCGGADGPSAASVEWPHAASDVVSSACVCRVARTAARLVTAAAACDVPETRAAAAAGGGRRASPGGRSAAVPRPGSGRGRCWHGVRAGRSRRLPVTTCGHPHLQVSRAARYHRAKAPAPLYRPALLQPVPLEPSLQARYVT